MKLSRINEDFNEIFGRLCVAYKKLFSELKDNNIHNVHLEEPAFCLDVSKEELKVILANYKKMIPDAFGVNLMTYYESVDFLKDLYELPFAGIGLDFIAGSDNIEILKKNGFQG